MFRVVQINNLGGSDMEETLFIESNEDNDPEIDKLIQATKIMGGSPKTKEGARFSEDEIMSFFRNPLARLYGVGCAKGHHDNEGTYVLRGQIAFPDIILSKDLVENSDTKSEQRKQAIARWNKSSLRYTKYPEWKNICEDVVEIEL